MRFLSAVLVVGIACISNACGPGVFSAPPPPAELHVAAAANLATIFESLADAEQKATGVRLVPSFGSTAQLTKQIEAGAPFDLFLAADTEHPIALASASLSDSPRTYAVGRVVIWAPKNPGIQKLEDLTGDGVKVIALANPDLAPYGKASVEALTTLHLWDRVKSKVVYGQNISGALAYATTGNADVALTAFSLVAAKSPRAPLVPAKLHRPIEQALCILDRTSQPAAARKAEQFLLGPEARSIFQKNGYSAP